MLPSRRQLLQERGVLAPLDGKLAFTQDFRFLSHSTAAGVLVGGVSNGRIAWKNANGKTLKAIQDACLAKYLSMSVLGKVFGLLSC